MNTERSPNGGPKNGAVPQGTSTTGEQAQPDRTAEHKRDCFPFQNPKAGSQPCLSRVPVIPAPLQGSEEPAAQPAVKTHHDRVLSPFCDNCERVEGGDPDACTFRIFIDRLGYTWRCLKPMSCDHAIVMGGGIVSCRVRTRQLKETGGALMPGEKKICPILAAGREFVGGKDRTAFVCLEGLCAWWIQDALQSDPDTGSCIVGRF